MKFYLFHISLIFISIGAFSQSIEKQLNYAESISHSSPVQSYEIARKIYDSGYAKNEELLRTLVLLTNTSNLTGKYSDVVQFGEKALTLSQKEGVLTSEIKVLGILGNFYQSIHLNEKTKIYLNKAEKLLDSSTFPDSLDYVKGNIYYLKGMNYANSLDCEMALTYFDKAINVYQSSRHALSAINLRLTYLNKGFCLIELRNFDKAEEYLYLSKIDTTKKESLDKFSLPFAAQQNAYSAFGYAELYAKEDDWSRSNQILIQLLKDESEKIINLAHVKSDVYQLLSENYLNLNDFENNKKFDLLYKKQIESANKIHSEITNDLLIKNQEYTRKEQQFIYKKNLFSIVFILLISLGTVIYLGRLIKKISQKNKNLKNQIKSRL